jgi:hypothetical protein
MSIGMLERMIFRIINNDEQMNGFYYVCNNGHKFGESLIKKFFNCLIKNVIKRLTEDADSGVNTNGRKKAKLW